MKKTNGKYQITYTFKDLTKPGFNRDFFASKKSAEAWLKKNKSQLYWHQLTETNPKSAESKPAVNFRLDSSYTKKTGTLQIHYETGMECTGLIFCEDGIYGPPNPNFDPSKPEDANNFKNFSSYDAMTFIRQGHILQFSNGEKIAMIKDPRFADKDGYRLSFYPQGFSRLEWVSLFAPGNVKVTLWTKKESK